MSKEIFLSAANFAESKVDAENFMINDVIIAEQIEPKDRRNLKVDDEFMEDFVKQAPKDGLTVEVDHNYFSQVGKKLGKVINVRFDSAKKLLIGDLQINPAADESPLFKGGATYLLNMLKNDNKAYMMSMKIDYKYLYAVIDGVKKKIKEAFSWSEGYTRKIDGDLYKGPAFMKLASIFGVDVVGEGGMTNSMFSRDLDGSTLQFLNDLSTHDGFKDFIEKNHDQLDGFNAFYKHKYQKSNFAKFKELLFIADEGDTGHTIESLIEEVDDAKTNLAKLNEDITGLNAKIEGTETKLATATTENATHLTTIENLNLEIERLKALPLGKHPDDTGGDEGGGSEKLYLKSPVTQRAMDVFSQNNKIN